MTTAAPVYEIAQPVLENGRLTLTVPWEQADQVQWALKRKGYPSTLCLNPESRQARLELWPGVPVKAVLLVLEDLWPGRKPARTDAPSPGRRAESSRPKTNDSTTDKTPAGLST
jgi:hypothetical protein